MGYFPKLFKVPRCWPGKTAIIVAGGPSLTLRAVRAIAVARTDIADRFRVMAVNDAVFPCWWADWLHACDAEWWNANVVSVGEFSGIRTTLTEKIPGAWVSGYLRNSGVYGFDDDPSSCRSGWSSAYQAMHIAIQTGVKRIILVGVDMKRIGGQSHWFGEHAFPSRSDYANAMIPAFRTLVPALEENGIDVVNTSMESALPDFPKKELEEVLR
jgi:hypothetical protein